MGVLSRVVAMVGIYHQWWQIHGCNVTHLRDIPPTPVRTLNNTLLYNSYLTLIHKNLCYNVTFQHIGMNIRCL